MNIVGISVLVLTAVQALHLYEEVRTGFRRQFPLGEIPKSVFVSVNVIGFAFAFVTAFLCFVEVSVSVIAAWMYAIIMLLNGFLHMGMIMVKKAYFPGGITACLILPAALNLIYQLSCK